MNIPIKKMTPKQQKEIYQKLLTALLKLKEPYQIKELLCQMTILLDDLDQQDFLGTEGWKHYLGLED